MARFELRARVLLGAALSLIVCACGGALSKSDAAPTGGGTGGSGHSGGCFQDSDCPTGLLCQAQQCVANDGKPPEQKETIFQQPQTSPHYVFALSPDNDSVAVIDPSTLAIRSITLPHEPYGLQVIPNQDAAVIVSRAGASVSFLSCDSQACHLQTQATNRHYPNVTASADGHWALLWTMDSQTPDEGAEGIVGVVDVSQLAAGTPVPIVERAAGRRDTNAFFRISNGQAADAVVIGEDHVAVIDLANLASEPLPQSIALPDAFSSVGSRNAVSSPDGAFAVVRSYASQDVQVLEVATRQLTALTMPGTPSDVELAANGTTALVVLRDTGMVATFPLPDALTDPSKVSVVPVTLAADGCTSTVETDGGAPDGGAAICTANAGQASLSPDGKLAALFTNVQASKSFAVLDLTTATVTNFDGLKKWVQTLGIGPDGHTVVVLHEPNPGSTAADAYQHMVDVSQGYSVVDLQANQAQLKLTQTVPPQEFVFSSDGTHAAVTLSDPNDNIFQIDAIDLQTLVTSTLSLASAPEFAGPFANSTSVIWVTQDHPAGRISFVDLSSEQVRTATGYALNSGISP